MRACRVQIRNFRGIKEAVLFLPRHGVLIGDNNTGKTTVLEALDLVLGPDRLSRQPPVDEHDFYHGRYFGKPAVEVAIEQVGDGVVADAAVEVPPRIEIEIVVTDLTDQQKAKFGDNVEFWDHSTDQFYEDANPAGVDAAHIDEALRLTFHGWYDPEEDDFEGRTYYSRSLTDGGDPVQFSKKDKQLCGFLYLRSLRTGSRALSLERGSLLDIILRLKELRPQMWEETITALSALTVASDPKLGISPVLQSINAALKKYVPKEWGVEPHLKVSNLTRENLRKIITAFIATGEGDHAAPFYRQGTGTINMLVLAMLSQIAEGKQNVIFAMEEPETAIPPYAQKRIVHEVRKLASQTIFTSHSPYVLEEFSIEETVVLARNSDGVLSQRAINLPDEVKLKRYRQEFRTRFCEGLLARRVLVAEGATEMAAFPAACRRLAELNPNLYSSIEALGVCIIDAGGEKTIPAMAHFYRELRKTTFAICDLQDDQNKKLILAEVDLLLMHQSKGTEDMVIEGTTKDALDRFAKLVDWPPHLIKSYGDPAANAPASVKEYFSWSKGTWGVSDFLAQCDEAEIPKWIRDAAIQLKEFCIGVQAPGDEPEVPAEAIVEQG